MTNSEVRRTGQRVKDEEQKVRKKRMAEMGRGGDIPAREIKEYIQKVKCNGEKGSERIRKKRYGESWQNTS